MRTRTSAPTCTSSLGETTAIWNAARWLSRFSDALSFEGGADAITAADLTTGADAGVGATTSACGGPLGGGFRSIGAGDEFLFGVFVVGISAGGAAAGSASGNGAASPISAGRDTPVLPSEEPARVFVVAAGFAGPSYAVDAYAFVFVHRSHQSPTVSYQSCEFCGFSIQCPSSGK